ncbi:helix-turn-helix domain-containing protein [Collinsella sp. An307]|uniref:helix-turn-helix domain-containing protein n=1 Tax=Collinsella sp. An307 TaxID=1965630 RepID=UPI000B3AF25C|nr:helix-turn-helix domain-containing protein [Collinsella sp. An307]OUO19309.1 hypothetical protein B5F89_08175 [Collinsella sp. An307]
MSAHKCPVEADERLLADADPERIFIDALSGFPYLMTPAQVASFTQTTPAGVRKLLAGGELQGSRMGARWVIPKVCLLRYLNGNRQ